MTSRLARTRCGLAGLAARDREHDGSRRAQARPGAERVARRGSVSNQAMGIMAVLFKKLRERKALHRTMPRQTGGRSGADRGNTLAEQSTELAKASIATVADRLLSDLRRRAV